jgi:septal ring factor EnvC (AmiA/AmiB activator)
MPPIDLQNGGIVATAVAIIAGVLTWRQQSKSESVERKAGMNFSEEAESARKDARLAWDERNKLAGEVGQLRAENGYLKEHVKKLEKRIASLERKLGIQTTDIMPDSAGR